MPTNDLHCACGYGDFASGKLDVEKAMRLALA